MFSESSSHYGFIDVLDIEETVIGVGDTSLIVTPTLAERAAAGEIESFAPNFVVDSEIVVAADPDVYITGGGADPAHDVIRAAGIPVIPNVEWLETTPEGWAEWVGLFAALTNTEAQANELYGQWTRRLRGRCRTCRGSGRATDGDHRRTLRGHVVRQRRRRRRCRVHRRCRRRLRLRRRPLARIDRAGHRGRARRRRRRRRLAVAPGLHDGGASGDRRRPARRLRRRGTRAGCGPIRCPSIQRSTSSRADR